MVGFMRIRDSFTLFNQTLPSPAKMNKSTLTKTVSESTSILATNAFLEITSKLINAWLQSEKNNFA